MNRGILGLPARPSTTSRITTLIADDATIGGTVERRASIAGINDDLGVPHLVGAIPHAPNVVAMAYCPAADRMVAVTNSVAGQCYVFHTSRHEVCARFRVGGPAKRVLIDPRTGLVIVARTDGVLAFVDPSTWRVMRLLNTGIAGVGGAVFAERRGTLLVHGIGGGVEVNTATLALTPFALVEDTTASVYRHDTDELWLASAQEPARLLVYGPFNVDSISRGQGIDGNFVGFATSSLTGTLYVVSQGPVGVAGFPYSNNANLIGGGPPTSICENTRTRRLYVGMTGIGGITVLNPPPFQAIVYSNLRCALPCGAPTALAYCPSNGLMYAAAGATSSLIALVS